MKLGKWMFWRPDERRVLLMGLDCTGKTTLLYRWLLGEITTTIPTIGFNVETIKYPAGYAFTMWDIGGCDKIRPLYRHYFPNTEFIIFFHNCADVDRLDEQVDLLKRSIYKDELPNVPVLVLLNMQDLLETDEKGDVMQKLRKEYESIAAAPGRSAALKVFNCPGFSATATENPYIVLDEVVRMLKDNQGNPDAKTSTNDLSKKRTADVSSDESDVERAKAMLESDSMTANEFWSAFEDGSLGPWNHYNHLRSGFFVLIDAFERGHGILDAAEEFIAHLERLRTRNPQRFCDTTHRTMSIFWLVQLQVAAANYTNSLPSAKCLQREDFQHVLLQNAQLANERLWSVYYSKNAMFTEVAKNGWCLSDLRPLSSTTSTSSREVALHPPTTVSDSERLIGFGLSVVKNTINSQARRGPVVKEALAGLQSAIMRDRTAGAAIPPYSETQAYFWVQIINAILESIKAQDGDEERSLEWADSVDSLTLTVVLALFGLTGDEWEEYYSEKVWNSIAARMQFRPPDKKALPNVIPVISPRGFLEAQNELMHSYAAEKQPASVLPPPRDLAIMASVISQEVKDGVASSHSNMIESLYRVLDTHKDSNKDPMAQRKQRSLAIAKALDMHWDAATGLTQKMFWVQHVLNALENFQGDDFAAFIRANADLAYKKLPLVYYSATVWASKEAEAVYIGPDRKPLNSRVA